MIRLHISETISPTSHWAYPLRGMDFRVKSIEEVNAGIDNEPHYTFKLGELQHTIWRDLIKSRIKGLEDLSPLYIKKEFCKIEMSESSELELAIKKLTYELNGK